MANQLNAAQALDWQLPTTPSFSPTKRRRFSVNEKQLSLIGLIANCQAEPAQADSTPDEKKRLGRPVRLRLFPHRETRTQLAERVANRTEYAEELDHLQYLRPRTRADCMPIRKALVDHLEDGHPYKQHAPCPFVSCAYHLHVDVHRTGDEVGMIELFDTISIAHTCALDLADEGGLRRKEIAPVLGVTEDRTLAMEKEFLGRMRTQGAFRRDLTEDDI